MRIEAARALVIGAAIIAGDRAIAAVALIRPAAVAPTVAAIPIGTPFKAVVPLAAAFGVVVSEPGSDLVARSLEEAAVMGCAAIARIIAVLGPSRAFITRAIPRVVTIICHLQVLQRLNGVGGKPTKLK